MVQRLTLPTPATQYELCCMALYENSDVYADAYHRLHISPNNEAVQQHFARVHHAMIRWVPTRLHSECACGKCEPSLLVLRVEA